jgi:alanine racemase
MRTTRPLYPIVQPVAVNPPAQPAKPDAQREPASWLEIDLTALASNVKAFLDLTKQADKGGAVVCGVVKKNAYGLGATAIGRKMVAAGCGMLAVYSPEEAQELVDAGLTVPLLVLCPVRSIQRTDPLYRALVAGRLHLSINDTQQLAELSESARLLGLRVPVHVHVDTGMSRGGLSEQELTDFAENHKRFAGLHWVGLMTHFATADEDPAFTQTQHSAFERWLEQHRAHLPTGLVVHVANSYAALRSPRYHHRMVRPGLGLYGYAHHAIGGEIGAGGGSGGGSGGEVIAEAPALRPTVRWCSRITQVHRYPAVRPVGYGSTWTTPCESLLGIVPVGYGDGYPLALSNKASVRVTVGDAIYGCPIRGRVNMDQLIVDLTEASINAEDAMHALVEVYSNDESAPNALHTLADLAGSHCYELLCRLNPRIVRRYV